MAESGKPPARLYKYRSMKSSSRAFTESIFRKNQVWFAQASTFNDPFDCNHYIDIDRTSDEWREILQQFERQFAQAALLGPGLLVQGLWNALIERYNENAEAAERPKLPTLTKDKLLELTRQLGAKAEVTFGGQAPVELVADESLGAARLNEVLNHYFEKSRQAVDERFGVFSLAEHPDNILLWSHYADEHAGICIEFDLASHPKAFPNTHAVRYQQESPVIEKRFANVLMNLAGEDRSLDEALLLRLAKRDVDTEWTDREIRSWFLTKSSLWQYEKEWRSILPGPGLKRIPAGAISGIVLGCKASLETEEVVRAWAQRRRRQVTISRALRRKGSFALDIVPI